MAWWSRKYNRPLKDPILLSYSIEELSYEYHIHNEIEKAAEEQVNYEADKIEEEKEKAAADWAAQMEEEEAQAAQAKDDATWMREHIADSKSVFGEDFGEDLNVEF